MNWKQATLAQLYEIAYNDLGAPLEHRIAAGTEIKRRARKRQNEIVQQKIKKIPRS